MPRLCLRHHMPGNFPQRVHRTVQTHIQQAVIKFAAQLRERDLCRDAGIGHGNIDVAKFLNQRIDTFPHSVFRAHIHLAGTYPCAKCTEFLHGGSITFRPPPPNDHIRPRPRQATREGKADASVGAGYQRDFTR